MAKKVVINSKMRRTSNCGAAETLLIDINSDINDDGFVNITDIVNVVNIILFN